MFNILKYQHELISDAVEIRVVFQNKKDGEIITDGGHFTSREAADRWLYDLKRLWFLVRTEKFLLHKQHIYEHGAGHKSVTVKKAILDQLIRQKNYAVNNTSVSLNAICNWLLTELPKFERILPSVKNPSYAGADEELKVLTDFASRQVNFNLLKKQAK